MIEMQKSILQKQDEILSRLVQLENDQCHHHHRMCSFDNKQDYSFELDDPPTL